MSLAENIKKLASDKSWSIAEVSRKSGIPLSTLKKIVYGVTKNHSQSTLEKIAKAFNVSVSSIISDNESSTSHAMDAYLFQESVDIVSAKLFSLKIKLDKLEEMNAIETIYYYLLEKRKRVPHYKIDDAFVSWVISSCSD